MNITKNQYNALDFIKRNTGDIGKSWVGVTAREMSKQLDINGASQLLTNLEQTKGWLEKDTRQNVINRNESFIEIDSVSNMASSNAYRLTPEGYRIWVGNKF